MMMMMIVLLIKIVMGYLFNLIVIGRDPLWHNVFFSLAVTELSKKIFVDLDKICKTSKMLSNISIKIIMFYCCMFYCFFVVLAAVGK